MKVELSLYAICNNDRNLLLVFLPLQYVKIVLRLCAIGSTFCTYYVSVVVGTLLLLTSMILKRAQNNKYKFDRDINTNTLLSCLCLIT